MWKNGQLITAVNIITGARTLARVIPCPERCSNFLYELQKERIKGARDKLPEGYLLSCVHPKSQKG